jgi:hypothetical protein
VSCSVETSWGPDLLDSAIPPGESFTIEGIPPGVYDVAAGFETPNGVTYQPDFGVTFEPGATVEISVNLSEDPGDFE